MAVDYFHRVVVSGPARRVAELRRGLAHTTSRRIEGRTFRERLPFSFTALYTIAPEARRVEPEFPGEPYDIRAWPIVRLERARAEIRYQLHTRNVELVAFLRVLSRRFPQLAFHLATHYLDGSEVVAFELMNGRVRRWLMPQSRRQVHWDRARKKFGLPGEDVYDDDDATLFAENGMRDEALDHWERQPRRSGRKRRPRQWWNRPVARDFTTEREIALIELADVLRTEEAASRGSGSTRRSKQARSAPRKRRRR